MNGADIVASVALGARFTLIGRAYLYGLMAGGRAGVDRAIQILAEEITRTSVQTLDRLNPVRRSLNGSPGVDGLTSPPTVSSRARRGLQRRAGPARRARVEAGSVSTAAPASSVRCVAVVPTTQEPDAGKLVVGSIAIVNARPNRGRPCRAELLPRPRVRKHVELPVQGADEVEVIVLDRAAPSSNPEVTEQQPAPGSVGDEAIRRVDDRHAS